MDKLLIVTSYSLIKIFQPDRLQDWKNKQKYKEHMCHLKMETWHWKPYLDIPSPYLISHSYPHAQPGAGGNAVNTFYIFTWQRGNLSCIGHIGHS